MTAPAKSTAVAAELPLVGGRAGAALTLRPLLCADMRAPAGWFHRTDGPTAALKAFGIGAAADQQVRVPIVAFLLEHPSAGLVLVDTAFHRSISDGPRGERSRNLGPVGRLMVRDLRMRAGQAIAPQLQALGIDPGEVAAVVMTHLHFDHASALCDFPAATVLLAEPEWIAAHGPLPFLHGYSRAQIDPRPSYRTIDFTGGGVHSHGPFEHSVDVFGDGSLILVSTPGHSLGHLSVIVRLAGREAFLTGDAVYTMATLRAGERPWRSEDPVAFEQSLNAIAEYDRENPDALLIPGHDMEAWEQLEELY